MSLLLALQAGLAAQSIHWIQLESATMEMIRHQAGLGSVVPPEPWKQFLGDVEKARAIPIQDIRAKKHPVPGVPPQDYVSLDPKVWPDPSKPDKKPWVDRGDKINPLFEEYDQPKLRATTRAISILAFSAYWTGNQSDAQRAAEHVRNWFIDPQTRMNPHLRYAQYIPGENQGRWQGIVEMELIIDDYVLDAISILDGLKALNEEEIEAVRQWFRAYLAWLDSDPMAEECSRANNSIATNMELQRVAMLMFCGNPEAARGVLRRIGPERVATQINAKGIMPAEFKLSKAFGHNVKNLRYFLWAALLGKRLGVDLAGYQAPSGASIRTLLETQYNYWKNTTGWPARQIEEFPWERPLRALHLAGWLYEDSFYFEAAINLPARDKESLASDLVLILHPAFFR